MEFFCCFDIALLDKYSTFKYEYKYKYQVYYVSAINVTQRVARVGVRQRRSRGSPTPKERYGGETENGWIVMIVMPMTSSMCAIKIQ